jgi:hypothetical protein
MDFMSTLLQQIFQSKIINVLVELDYSVKNCNFE